MVNSNINKRELLKGCKNYFIEEKMKCVCGETSEFTVYYGGQRNIKLYCNICKLKLIGYNLGQEDLGYGL